MCVVELSNFPKNLTERQVRFLLNGHKHDGVSSALIPQFMNREFVSQSISTSAQTIGGGVRPATIVFAASDSSSSSQTQADIVCDGLNDMVIVNDGLSSLSVSGGKALFLEGNYQFNTPGGDITVPENTILEGIGSATIFNLTSFSHITLIKMKNNCSIVNMNINIILTDPNATFTYIGPPSGSTYRNSFSNLSIFGYGTSGSTSFYAPNAIFNNCNFFAPDGFQQFAITSDNSSIPLSSNPRVLMVNNCNFTNTAINCSADISIINNNFFTGSVVSGHVYSQDGIVANNIFYNCFSGEGITGTLVANASLILNNIFLQSGKVFFRGQNLFSGNNILSPQSNIGSAPVQASNDPSLDFICSNYINCSEKSPYAVFIGGFSTDEVVVNNYFLSFTDTFSTYPGIRFNSFGSTGFQDNLDGSANHWNYTG